MMVEDLGFSIFIVLPPNMCWKILKGCSCGSEASCPVLMSGCSYDVAVSSAACIVTPSLAVWSNCQILLVEQLEVPGAAPWCIQQGQKQNCVCSSSYWLLKSIIKNLITSENSSVTG